MPNEHAGEPGEGSFPGQTYLFIRTNPGDDGNEPLLQRFKHWKSPDIAVVQPNGKRGAEAVAGQNNQLEVTVHNAGGLDATDAWVDAFVTDPSTGISPATASLVGAGNLSVPTAASRAIAFPWQPSTADAGHRCLIARVALYFPFDAYVGGSKFEVRKDRHVAQRNISVIQMGGQTNVTFAFAMVNPRNRATTMYIRPRELRKTRELNRIRACLGCGLAQFGEKKLPSV